MSSRSLILVHAHPDDEALSTGGTIARYADAGVRVCLVTCTNGEMGEIAELPELGDPEDIRPRLGEVRIAELTEACRRLGSVDLRLLGFHDSGMDGTPANDDPRAFIKQDLEEPTHKLVQIIRSTKPQVLITYNENGFYGHPDHIRAHEVAMRAVDAASDASYAPELGASFEVAKTYYTAVPRSMLQAGRDMAKEIFGPDAGDFFTDEEIERIGTDDAAITTTIDVSGYVEQKFHALEAHVTQRGTTERFLNIPSDYRALAMGSEHYVLARSRVPQPEGVEQDLFERVDAR